MRQEKASPKQICYEGVETRYHRPYVGCLRCEMLRGSRRKDGPTGRRINLTTASMLSSILRTLVSVLPGAIILPVVIHLIKFRSLIDYHADQVRIVQRLQTLLQGLKRGHTL